MGRRPHGDSRRRINLYIGEAILAELQLYYFDPARGKPKYGMLSDIVNNALKEHLMTIKTKPLIIKQVIDPHTGVITRSKGNA